MFLKMEKPRTLSRERGLTVKVRGILRMLPKKNFKTQSLSVRIRDIFANHIEPVLTFWKMLTDTVRYISD